MMWFSSWVFRTDGRKLSEIWFLKQKFKLLTSTLTRGYHSKPKVDICFWTTFFGSFHTKVSKNLKFFCSFQEGYPGWNLFCKFGLVLPLYGPLVTVFVSCSFSWFNDFETKMPIITWKAQETDFFAIIRFSLFSRQWQYKGNNERTDNENPLPSGKYFQGLECEVLCWECVCS